VQDTYFDLLCNTDENIKPNLKRNGFTSPLLKNVDMSNISKYSATMYGNFKSDKMNAADKALKSTPQLDLNANNKIFSVNNNNIYVSNDRFLSEDHAKKKI